MHAINNICVRRKSAYIRTVLFYPGVEQDSSKNMPCSTSG